MHLDDGLIANLSPERLEVVLRTKVDGIVNLSNATNSHKLDFFVAYSSATTLIGSPGQGGYVAANGFLEGFMRGRRAQGKPGLAIGWGAISDVGPDRPRQTARPAATTCHRRRADARL